MPFIVEEVSTPHEESSSEGSSNGLRKFWPAAALMASLGLALRGQQLITNPKYPFDGPVFFALSAALFLGTARFWSDLRSPRQRSSPQLQVEASVRPLIPCLKWRLMLMGITVVLAVLAYVEFADNRFTTEGILAWSGAVICFLMASAARPTGKWWRIFANWWRRDRWMIEVKWVHLALMGITLLAIFFRVHRLAEVPAEMISDHAEKLLDVNDVLHGLRPVFFPRNTGREALQFYLTAALIRMTPLDLGHLALKVGTAVIGIITVPLAYLLGHELYGRDVGLVSAALLAVSHWHVAITRVGLRFPFTAAFATPTLYFLFRAFRHDRRNDWLACGLVLGVGLHTYTAMRIVPLLLIILTGIKALLDSTVTLRHGQHKLARASVWHGESSALSPRFWRNGLLGGIMSLLVFLPLLRYMHDYPKMFWYRALTRVSNLERQIPADRWHTFLVNVKNALLMFNYRGDVAWLSTVPHSPVLGLVTAALFVPGVVYLMWRLLKRGDRRSLYVLLALFVLLLPSILSLAFPRENPSVARAGGAVPIATLIAALPLYTAARYLQDAFGHRGRAMALFLTVALLVLAICHNYHWYFVKYDRQFRRRAWNSTDMGRVIRGFAESVGDLDHAYHVAYPHWVDTRNIAINAGDISWRNAILDIEQAAPQVEDPAPKLYLVHLDDSKALSFLRCLFPQARVRRYRAELPSRDFWIVFVPSARRLSGHDRSSKNECHDLIRR